MSAEPQVSTVSPFTESLRLLLESSLLENMVHVFNYSGIIRQLLKDRVNIFEKQ